MEFTDESKGRGNIDSPVGKYAVDEALVGNLDAAPTSEHAAMRCLDVERLVQCQRQYFVAGKTRAYEARMQSLRNLKSAVKQHELMLCEALWSDLRKPYFEAFGMEVAQVYEELNLALRRLKRWMRPKRVRTPLALLPSKSYVIAEPYGNVLIIAPSNYPVQLALIPLIGALAAGNTVVLKPSEDAPAVADVLDRLLRTVFGEELVQVVPGGVEESQALLSQKFDHIFFTGGTRVGRIIAAKAAENLTPCTLELGGKSPCIVTADCNLTVSVRRILWGKYANAGQTCVAPDYLLVDRRIRDAFVAECKKQLVQFYSDRPETSPDYGRIVSVRAYDRLVCMLQDCRILIGGKSSRPERYIAPTLVDEVDLHHPLMSEEIFGPILPLLTYDKLEEALGIVQSYARPLALYVFSEDKATQERITRTLAFGGGGINETIACIGSAQMPFGGVGESGYGDYHGHYSFMTFTYRKAIMETPTAIDVPVRYPPYGNKHRLLKALFR